MFGNAHTEFDCLAYDDGSPQPALALDLREFATVYRYRYWDDEKAELVTSKWEATLECIRCGLGNPVIASGRRVPAGDLDAFGRLITVG